MRPPLLFLSLNDGSDTRIYKEIATLARGAAVHFLGVAQESSERAFVREHCTSCTLIAGRRRSPITLGRLWMKAAHVRLRVKPASTHVINEDLALTFLPQLVLHRRVVLDIFDSLFLRESLPSPLRAALQRTVYGVSSRILVTDTDRAALMPAFVRPRLAVLENYPYAYRGAKPPRPVDAPLRIYVNGSITRARGTEFVLGLLQLPHPVEVVVAGWLYDEAARELSRHPRVQFLGTVTQQRSMELAAAADYILCLYEPSNRNNIFASPNKIYDAIQAGTPVIISRETRVARFVEEHSLGVLLDSFYERDFAGAYARLLAFRSRFRVPIDLKKQCTWEAIEERLLEAHGLERG